MRRPEPETICWASSAGGRSDRGERDIVLSGRWRRKLRFLGLALALCALGVVIALALSRFLNAFYTNIPLGYEPKDISREKSLEQHP